MAGTEQTVDLDQTLHERFALERFRPGQREVIEQVLAGRDVLCVMPTGGGKSLCYQFPAVVLQGLTLVVSPLIALMKDQVDALLARGIRATLINSSLDLAEQNARMAEIELGRYDLLYVAPERFGSSRFIELMKRVKPALLAVDEAHCISEWGHDFRPDYARIGAARRELGLPPCIALTATATDIVRRDIALGLDLRDPQQFVTGFDRPNLTYHGHYLAKDAQKFQALARVLERNKGPAIVYASSRKKCVEVRSFIQDSLHLESVIYHAGMDREARSASQEKFMTGTAQVVVATNAFGMGVDKADIRSVIHFNMPGTLEAYYQEAGRAGRDGEPAECVLMHSPGDRILQEMFIENEYPSPDSIHKIYDFLRGLDADPIELTQAEISEVAGTRIHELAVGAALRILETAGALERFRPRENMAIVRVNLAPEDVSIADRVGPTAHVQKLVAVALEGLVNRRFGEPVYFQPDGFATKLGLDRTAFGRAVRNLAAEFPIDYIPPFRGNAIQIRDRDRKSRDLQIDFQALEARKKQEYDKLNRMLRYSDTRDCRRSFILQYFGDEDAMQCGHCDNCWSTNPITPLLGNCRIDSPTSRVIIQKILSGVARTKAKYGRLLVSQMLVGSGAEKMERLGLNRLTTFGVLANSGFTGKEVTQLIDALIVAGLIVTDETDGFHPVVKLSEAGWAWIRDSEPPPISLLVETEVTAKLQGGERQSAPIQEPVKAARPKSVAVASSDSGWIEDANDASWQPAQPVLGDPLWERLKSLRADWSKQSGVKAFQVFTNKVLDDMVRLRPTTPQLLAAVKGIGPATMEKYGSALLETIRLAEKNGRDVLPLEEEPPSPPKPLSPPKTPSLPEVPPQPIAIPKTAPATSYVSTEEWTGRLLDRGFTIHEAASIRGLEVSAIVRHAVWLVKKGQPLQPRRFLPADVVNEWDAYFAEHGTTELAPGPLELAPFWPLFVAAGQQV